MTVQFMNNKIERSKSGHRIISGTNLASGWLERENKKTLSQDSQYASWDSKWVSPEYNTHSVSKETMMLQYLLTQSVMLFEISTTLQILLHKNT